MPNLQISVPTMLISLPFHECKFLNASEHCLLSMHSQPVTHSSNRAHECTVHTAGLLVASKSWCLVTVVSSLLCIDLSKWQWTLVHKKLWTRSVIYKLCVCYFTIQKCTQCSCFFMLIYLLIHMQRNNLVHSIIFEHSTNNNEPICILIFDVHIGKKIF